MNPEQPKGVKPPEKEKTKETSIVAGVLQGKLLDVEGLLAKSAKKPELAAIADKLKGRLEVIGKSLDDHKENPGNILDQFIFLTKTYVSLIGVEGAIKEAEHKTKEAEEIENTTKKLQESQHKLEAAQGEKLKLSSEQEEKLKQDFTKITNKVERESSKKDERIADGVEEVGNEVEEEREKLVFEKRDENERETDKQHLSLKARLAEQKEKVKTQKALEEERRRVKALDANVFQTQNGIYRKTAEYLDEMRDEFGEIRQIDLGELGRRSVEELYGAYGEMSESEKQAKRESRGRANLNLDVTARAEVILDDDLAEDRFDKFFQRAYAQQSENFYKTMSFRDQIDLIEFFDSFLDEKAIRLAVEKQKTVNGRKLSFEEMQIEARKKLNRFSKEYVARANLFNGHMGVENGWIPPGDFFKAMGSMTSELWGYVFPKGDVSKASYALNLYENAFQGSIDVNGKINWSDVATIRGEDGKAESVFDEKIRKQFKQFLEFEKFRLIKNAGEVSPEKLVELEQSFEKKWSDQKVSKALTLAKSFFVVSLRAPEIVAKGRFERGSGNAMKSQPYEDYTRALDFYEWFSQKYWVGGPAGIMLYNLFGDNTDSKGKRKSVPEIYRDWKDGKLHNDASFMKNMRNMFGIGGYMTESGWRGPAMAERVLRLGENNDLKKLLGINIRLQGKSFVVKSEGGHGHGGDGEIVPAKKARESGDYKYRAQVWEDALWMNPMTVIHEAQTMMGYSNDYQKGLWKKVYDNFGASIEDKGLIQAREDLSFVQATSLAMVEVPFDNLEGFGKIDNKTFLKFELLGDVERRNNAKKLFNSIREVAGDKLRWQIDADGKKVEGDGIDKPFTSGTEYLNVVDFLALRAGEYLKQGLAQNDVRHDILSWEETGHFGWQRRLRDYSGAVGMQGALPKFFDQYGLFKTPIDIVAYLQKEVMPNMRSYDGDKAADFSEKLIKSIAEFHREPRWWSWAPAPIPQVWDTSKRLVNDWKDSLENTKLLPKGVRDRIRRTHLPGIFENSDTMSEEVLGEEAMITSAVSTRELISHARLYGLFGGGHKAHEIERRLFRETRSKLSNVFGELMGKYWVFGLGVFTYVLVKEFVNVIEQDFAGGSGAKKSSGHH